MVGSPYTWCGAHIHGGLASQPASFGGGPGWGEGAHNGRWIAAPPPPNLAPHQSWPAGWPGHHVCGLHTMYVGSPPCMGSPPCIRYQVSRYPSIQVSRYPDIQISRYPDIQMSRCPDVQISKKRRTNLNKSMFPKSKKVVPTDRAN